MDKPDTVRIADDDDIENLFWTLIAEETTDWAMGLEVSEPKVLSAVRAACMRDNSCAGIIDGPNGTILGSVGIRAEEPWFSPTTILAQMWMFVDERARGTRYADDLHNFAMWHREDMSRRVGYNLIFENSVMSLTRLPAKIRLWSRYGEQIGAMFWSRGDQNGEIEQQATDVDVHNGAVEPGGHERLQQPAGEREHPGEPAPATLQRPTRSAAERESEHGDQHDRQQRKSRGPVFD